MRTDKDEKVLDINEIIYELAVNAARKQILFFSKQLKAKMLSVGITRQVAEDVIKEAFRGYKTMETFHSECHEPLYNVLEAYLQPNNRSRDVLGRLVIEYSLFKITKQPLLHPMGSNADTEARKRFMRNALPRPLISYFLVSMRGTIEGIDSFEARPVLFGVHNPVMAERRESATAIREHYTTLYKHDKRVVDWEAVYKDQRSMRLAFDVLGDVLQAMEGLGNQRMLKIIQNIQNYDKPVSEKNQMKREFVLDDIRLFKGAMTRAWEMLAKALGVDIETG